MRITLLVAMAANRVIGRDGGLPWHLSADLQRFRRLTMGHTLVMGRKTYESIGRPLPGRTTIVLSRDPSFQADGVGLARTLEEALDMAADDPEVFIVGGSTVFAEALPLASRICLTRVHAMPEGDVFFPEVDWDEWRLIDREPGRADARNEFDYTFETFERVSNRNR